MDTSVKRGDIYYADLSPVVGSEQGGVRPVLIIQNDTGNRYSPTVIAAAITSQTGKAKLPTHIDLPVNANSGLSRNSVILLEQIRTLDKKRLSGRGNRGQFRSAPRSTGVTISAAIPDSLRDRFSRHGSIFRITLTVFFRMTCGRFSYNCP